MSILTKILLCIVVVGVAGLLGATLGYTYATGSQARTEIKLEDKAVKNEEKIDQKNEAAAALTIKTITQTVIRTQTIVKEVPVVQVIHEPAPVQDCPAAITGVDRVLIDAAAGNTDPAPGAGTDDPPYPAGPLTTVVIDNYGACNRYINQLNGLEDYVENTLKNQKLLCPTH